MTTILLYYTLFYTILYYTTILLIYFLSEVVITKGEINIHVKNVRESSWERFKNELERVTGSERPGLGKAISDAMDYYVEHVLQARANKEWGGGVRKKVFRREEKLKSLIQFLHRDLEHIHPEYIEIDIYYDFSWEDWLIRYIISDKQLKNAIRRHLDIVDRHTVQNYVDSLIAKGFIIWEHNIQKWRLNWNFWLNDNDREEGKIPDLHRIKKKRIATKGTPEYEKWGKKEKKAKKEPYRDLPIIVPVEVGTEGVME